MNVDFTRGTSPARQLVSVFCLVVTLTVSLSCDASAAVQVFTDLQQWQAAAGATQLETFDSVPLGPIPVGLPTPIGAVTIDIEIDRLDEMGLQIQPGDSPLAIDGTPLLAGAIYSGDLLHLPEFVFTPAITAFAADWRSISDGKGLVAHLGQDSVPLSDYLTSGDGFLGIVSDTPFTRLSLTTIYQSFGMDNVRWSVPEPSGLAATSLYLMALLTSLNSYRHRMRLADQ